MQKPFFSVIIPAYNLGKYIATTIQSVLAQTFQDFEIIVVNDGSTDETVSIIQSFHDPRIHLVSQPNGGVSRARNAGMKKAQGSYIAFLDGDDYWYPEHLALATDFFNLHPKILVYSNLYMLDELASIPTRPPIQSRIHSEIRIKRIAIHELQQCDPEFISCFSAFSMGRKYALWGRRTVLDTIHEANKPDPVTSIYRQRASSAMHDENYQRVSLHELITPLLNELEAMKKPTWQFAVHYLIVRELHPNRLLSLDEKDRTSLLSRIRRVMHPYLNRPYFDAYMKACSARAGMEQSLSALMNRTLFSCRWLDRLERMGRSMFFLNRNQ